MKWYRLATEQGHVLAQYHLGVCYDEGRGVTQDYVKAYTWFNLAAAQGNKFASTNRNTIMQKMTPTQIEEGQRLSREYAEKYLKK